MRSMTASSCARVPKALSAPALIRHLQRAAVHLAQVHALAKIVQVAERPAVLARGQDGFHRPLAHVLDGAQAIADGRPLDALRLVFDGKVQAAVVDVGRQHLDAQPPRLGDEQAHLFDVALFHGQQGGHVLDRVVGLQVGRLAR